MKYVLMVKINSVLSDLTGKVKVLVETDNLNAAQRAKADLGSIFENDTYWIEEKEEN